MAHSVDNDVIHEKNKCIETKVYSYLLTYLIMMQNGHPRSWVIVLLENITFLFVWSFRSVCVVSYVCFFTVMDKQQQPKRLISRINIVHWRIFREINCVTDIRGEIYGRSQHKELGGVSVAFKLVSDRRSFLIIFGEFVSLVYMISRFNQKPTHVSAKW